MAYGVNAPFGLKPICSITGGTWSEKFNTYYIFTNANGTTTYGTSIFTGDPLRWNTAAAQLGTIAQYAPGYTDNTPSTFSAVPVLGVFHGCEYFTPNGTLIKSPYWVANTPVLPGSVIKAFVVDDPNVVYEVQVSTHIDAAANAFVGKPIIPVTNANLLLAGSFGNNFALNVGGGATFNTVANPNGGTYNNNPASGNTLTGLSAFYLDASTPTGGAATHDYNKTVATLPLKLIGWSDNVQNQPQLSPFTIGGIPTLDTTPFLNVRVMLNNSVYGHNAAGTTLV